MRGKQKPALHDAYVVDQFFTLTVDGITGATSKERRKQEGRRRNINS